MKHATLYTKYGFVMDLPNLNEARIHHGCAMFINQHKQKVCISSESILQVFKQVLIVAGGNGYFSMRSTELMPYLPGSSRMKWTMTGSLPMIMEGVRMVNLNNDIYMFGGNQNGVFYDHILHYKDDKWTNVGKMKTKRGWHAVSVVNYTDVCK